MNVKELRIGNYVLVDNYKHEQLEDEPAYIDRISTF